VNSRLTPKEKTMKRLTVATGGVALLAMAAAVWAQTAAPAGAPATPAAKPTIPQVCMNCHKAEPSTLQGVFENVAFKSKSIQLKIDNSTEIVRFDEKTLQVVDGGKPLPGEALREIAKGREAKIVYAEKDGIKTASKISFKGPIKIEPEKLVMYDEVARLVALGPEQGNFTLIDSRPLPRFQEGTIPGAINLPYPAFDKFVDRLPKQKDRLTIFFCQGVTCMMSPNSLRRAEAMGYTKVRVYREGMPEWAQKNAGVIAAPYVQEAWIAKDIPFVLIDVRPASTVAATGFIPGAVSIPVSQVPAAIAKLPDPKLKAPIMVYDGDGGTAAKLAAKLISDAGQVNVNYVGGGFDAWKAGGNKVATGAPASTVAYAPKPRPGEISIDEFRKLATATPPDVLILDVRNQDEANAGMIQGAKLVPDEEILARMSEIPKDKRIVTHCSTGIRAEMAYHKLKDAGYKVAFVKADIEIDKKGNMKISKP
jgi:rhodanese-related sulfurtransferase